MNKPVNVSITGAAGNIAYSAIFRIASGQMLGNDQPINLNLIDIEPAINAMTVSYTHLTLPTSQYV